MSIAFGPVALEPLALEVHGRGIFRLLKPVTVYADGGATFVVPQGFITDGASIPWWARFSFGSWGRAGRPSILHDFLLSCTDVAKRDADAMLKRVLLAAGVPAWRAQIMWLAVRARSAALARKRQAAMQALAAPSPLSIAVTPLMQEQSMSTNAPVSPWREQPTFWLRLKASVALAWRESIEPTVTRLLPTLRTRTGSRVAAVAVIGAVGAALPQLHIEKHLELLVNLFWLGSLIVGLLMALMGRMNAAGPVMMPVNDTQRGTLADVMAQEEAIEAAAASPARAFVAAQAPKKRPARKGATRRKPKKAVGRRVVPKSPKPAQKRKARKAKVVVTKRAAKRSVKRAGGRR